MKVTDKITITNEDNMVLMARYPDKHFDLALIDIPYGLGDKLTQGGTWASKYKKGDADWDVIPDKAFFDELFRVSKNQIIWGGNYADLPPARCFIIWDKVALMETMADCEFAWTSFDKNAKIFRHVRNTSEKRIHITQKPVALYKWLLQKYANELIKCENCLGSGEIESLSLDCDVKTCNKCKGKGTVKPKILDTHIGSMSIAIACHDMGFELTGCELDSDYYAAGIERIKRHVSQLSLFEPEELTQTKQTLF